MSKSRGSRSSELAGGRPALRGGVPGLPAVERRRSMRATMFIGASSPRDVVERMWSAADQLIANAAARVDQSMLLKDGDRSTVAKIIAGESALVLKRYNPKGGAHTAVHAIMRSRARWCWSNGRRLLAAGLLTPQPLAMLEERRAGILRLRSYLLTEYVDGESLRALIDSAATPLDRVRDLARQFATIWQKLGQLRLGHGDMKATNFIVDRDERLWLIDLDGMRQYRSRAMLRRERRSDLARFMRNWQDLPEVAAAFRARIGTG